MSLKEFFNGNNLNKLNERFKNLLSVSSYDRKETVLLNHTRFMQLDNVGYARNGMTNVMQLVNQTTEVESIYFDKSHRGSVQLYVKTKTRSNDLGHNSESMLIVYKDKKGKRLTHVIKATRDSDDIQRQAEGFYWSFGRHTIKAKDLERSWELSDSYRKRLIEFYTTKLHYTCRVDLANLGKELTKHIESIGFKIIALVPFTESYWLTYGVKFVKQTKNKIELGMRHQSTYNSLPETLTIEILKDTKKEFVSLHKLKVEERGHYSHDDRMMIKKDQLALVKKFNSSFNRKSRG